MDKIITAMAYDKKVRVYAALSTDTVNEAIRRHGLNLMAAMALGRLLTATAMMSSMSKHESIVLSISTDASMKGVTAIADSKGKVKGYVHNNDYTTYKEDFSSLGQLLMPGKLTIIKDMGLKEPYTGIIPLVSGEIAEDIAKYFTDSEQTPTACALGTYFNEEGELLAAGGFIIQVMPDTDEVTLKELEQRIALVENVSKLIYDLKTPESVLNFMFSDRNLEIMATEPLSFSCSCNKDDILNKLLTIDKEQLRDVAAQQSGIEAVCPYCNNHYNYDSKDIIELLKNVEE